MVKWNPTKHTNATFTATKLAPNAPGALNGQNYFTILASTDSTLSTVVLNEGPDRRRVGKTFIYFSTQNILSLRARLPLITNQSDTVCDIYYKDSGYIGPFNSTFAPRRAYVQIEKYIFAVHYYAVSFLSWLGLLRLGTLFALELGTLLPVLAGE